jgi:hypothetical protein
MPTKVSLTWFNARYLESFFKVAEGRQQTPSICIHNTAPDEPTIVLAGNRPDFMGVIMPMRGQIEAGQFPTWWTAPTPTKSDAKKATEKKSAAKAA